MRDISLFMHFSGLIIGAGTGFALFCIGQLSKNFDDSYRGVVMQKLFALRYISYAGLLILLVSGAMLIGPYMTTIDSMPIFAAKLLLVTLLVFVSTYGLLLMGRVRKGKGGTAMQTLRRLGKLSLVLSFSIVACAVYSFH